jgi:tRNA-Thr(GGU) m(6)t(6)A37 methyltransferase TsaA
MGLRAGRLMGLRAGRATSRPRHDSMARMNLDVPLRAIGVVRTSHASLETTPSHAALNRAEHGTIEVDDAYREGLDGLADFDYAWLLTWLDRPDGPAGAPALKLVPFLLRQQRRQMGLFATRSPRRVNPIGLSLIQILDITGPLIAFAGVDLLDGTPVIDLKPYVSRFDRPTGEPRCGWFDQVTITGAGAPPTPTDDRPGSRSG